MQKAHWLIKPAMPQVFNNPWQPLTLCAGDELLLWGIALFISTAISELKVCNLKRKKKPYLKKKLNYLTEVIINNKVVPRRIKFNNEKFLPLLPEWGENYLKIILRNLKKTLHSRVMYTSVRGL